MNFDTYEINKIFYNHISHMSDRGRYGFNFWGTWGSPKVGNFFDVSLDSKDINLIHWLHSPYYSVNATLIWEEHSYFCQIDQNYFSYEEEESNYCFSIHGKETEVSLRELVLFMMYMKYLSSLCV